MIFIHTSDTHLGKTFSESPNAGERARDFHAALDAIVAYALEERADAVVVAGDLFHDAEVMPRDFAAAATSLEPLRAAGIPVVAVEGNHDWIHRRNRRSWVEALSELGYLILLRPEQLDDATYAFPEWDPSTRTGGRIEIAGVTFFGLGYIGAFAGAHVERICEAAIATGAEASAVLFHVGVRSFCPNEVGCMGVDEALPLADAFGYVALGHGHKPYVVRRDGNPFAFNPGSPESVNFGEERYVKGFNRVIWSPGEAPVVTTIPTSPRPMLNAAISLDGAQSVAAAEALLRERAAERLRRPDDARRPVVRVKLTGSVGFRPVELSRERVLEALGADLDPLHVEVENAMTVGRASDSAAVERSLADVERLVVAELLAAGGTEPGDVAGLVDLTLEVKRHVLEGKTEAEALFEMIHSRFETDGDVAGAVGRS